jgi:hypothetical protein
MSRLPFRHRGEKVKGLSESFALGFGTHLNFKMENPKKILNNLCRPFLFF